MSTNSETAADPGAADTAEFSAAEQFADHFFAEDVPALRVTVGAATHPGSVRENNEDHYAVIRRTRTREVVLSNLPAGVMLPHLDEAHLFMVADGIGGAAFGELASRLVIQTTWELEGQATSWVMKLTDIDALQLRERVSAYVQRIEERLREYGRDHPELAGMGTTLTCAHVMGRDAVITHIGDSRVYLCRGGVCRQITSDHTLGELLKSGGLDARAVDRMRHVLVNCLAVNQTTRAVPELRHVALEDGDRLLVCTDGLSEMVADEEIGEVIDAQPDPQPACDELIRRALQHGGRDNVTVVLAAITSAAAGGKEFQALDATRAEPLTADPDITTERGS
jgi:protein phosphatase